MRGCAKELLVAVAAAVGMTAPILCAQTASTPVVVTGDAAPNSVGGSLGLNFAMVSVPFTATPTSGGSVAAIGFQASLSGAPGGGDEGIWAGMPGTLRLTVREGEATPGISGSTFHVFSRPQVDGSGRVAFWASYDGSVATHGIWAGMPGSIDLVARTAMTAPGFAGGTFLALSDGDHALISPGQVSFRALVRGGDVNGTFTNDSGIFISSSSLQLAVREGAVAPGTVGATWGDFVTAGSTPVINASGRVAFRNTLADGDTTPTNAQGIWTATTSSASIVVRADDLIAGAGTPKFASFSTQPSLNNAGTVAYRATLQNGVEGVGTGDDTGIWIDSTTSAPTLVAREGTELTIGGPQFGDLADNPTFGRVVINSGGKVAFIAPLSGPAASNQGLFVGSDSASLGMIARKGQTAPGTGGAATFEQFDTNFTINSGGQVAFIANVSGLSGLNDNGIWAVDPWSDIVAVAVEGTTLDTGIGEKIISNASGLGMTGNSTEVEGRSAGFTDTGILAFTASFVDGTTGIFNARVGGTSRVKATAPTLGPAVGNSFFTAGSGLAHNTVGTVSGDIGYLKFQGFAVDATNNFNIFLDFVGANIAGAVAELNRGAAVHGYTVNTTNAGAFDALLVYAGANDGASKFFYWNFSNIDNVDLVSVSVTPEPGSMLAIGGAIMLLGRRRRS